MTESHAQRIARRRRPFTVDGLDVRAGDGGGELLASAQPQR